MVEILSRLQQFEGQNRELFRECKSLVRKGIAAVVSFSADFFPVRFCVWLCGCGQAMKTLASRVRAAPVGRLGPISRVHPTRGR